MKNPILSAMGQSNNNIFNLMTMLKKGNPEQIAQQMARNNPKFAEFMRTNHGKSPERIAQEYGLSPDILKSILK